MSNFFFVDDVVLQKNLDIAFNHIAQLASLSESKIYSDALRGSFRKSAMVNTASIIEALLLWMLKKKLKETDLKKETTSFKILKEIYSVNDRERIVLGRDEVKIEHRKFSKLNFAEINPLCREQRIIREELYKKIDQVRVARNGLHIGGLAKVEEGYSKKELEFIFSVAKEVKSLAKNFQK